MNDLLIDTNIYSHAMRGDGAVTSVLRRAASIALSAISIGELLSGFRGGVSERANRDELAEFLDSPRVVVLGITEKTAEFYAGILDGLRRAGRPIGAAAPMAPAAHDSWPHRPARDGALGAR